MEGIRVTLRTYRAYTMSEALAAVKRDLGADAAILHTRTVRRGGMFGLGKRTVVEVTASRADERENLLLGARRGGGAPAQQQQQQQRAGGTRKSEVAAPAARRAYAQTTTAAINGGSGGGGAVALMDDPANPLDLIAAIKGHRRSAPPPDQVGKAAAAAMVERKPLAPPAAGSASARAASKAPAAHARVESVAAPPVIEVESLHPRSISPGSVEAAPRSASSSASAPSDAPPEAAAVAQRFILMRVKDGEGGKGRVVINRVARSNAEATKSELLDQIAQPVRMKAAQDTPERKAAQEEMRAIRDMVGQILHHQTGSAGCGAAPMPRALFDVYLRLIGQELAEETADGIAARVQQCLSPQDLEDPARVRDAVRKELVNMVAARATRCDEARPDGRPLTIALIGPTGVGKTTTLAKLAATFKLHHGRRVGLVTSDTYRIAAVDQLRTYANIISVPLRIALTPQEMRHACHQMRDCDVILIDTAGRSQRDREKLTELSQFIEAADPHEVHMVLSSTAGERVLSQEAASFGAVRCDRLIVTKIDEAVSYGTVINLVRQVGKPLSFITTGQEVPDHIEPARAERIADLVLG